jgi:hypothetical protein
MAVGWERSPRGGARRAGAVGLTLALAFMLAACSFGDSGSGASDQTALSALPWCVQPQISFVDSGSSSQQTITQWDQVKGQLGFTPYLPDSLPKGTCLDLVGGAIHDPVFGGHLSITWILPGGNPISFSEAPKRGNTAATPQCEQSAGSTPTTPPAGQATSATTVCIGAVGDTSVTVASFLPQSQVVTYFKTLKPASNWEPAPAS